MGWYEHIIIYSSGGFANAALAVLSFCEDSSKAERKRLMVASGPSRRKLRASCADMEVAVEEDECAAEEDCDVVLACCCVIPRDDDDSAPSGCLREAGTGGVLCAVTVEDPVALPSFFSSSTTKG